MPRSSLSPCVGCFFRSYLVKPRFMGKGEDIWMHTLTVSINKPCVQEDKQIWIESKRKVPIGDYCGTSFKHLQNILFFSSLHEHVCGHTCFCLTSIESVSWLEVCVSKIALTWHYHVSVRMLFCTFARSAMLLLTCWGSAGFFTAQIWKRATAASTEDTRDAFWKPSECELLCHYINASGRSSELRV